MHHMVKEEVQRTESQMHDTLNQLLIYFLHQKAACMALDVVSINCMHTCTHAHIFSISHVHIHVCLHMYVYARVHEHIYACVGTFMYAFTCINMHVHT